MENYENLNKVVGDNYENLNKIDPKLNLNSKYFEGDKDPKSEIPRQLAHLRENLMNLKRKLTDEDSIKLADTAIDRAVAILMQFDRLNQS